MLCVFIAMIFLFCGCTAKPPQPAAEAPRESITLTVAVASSNLPLDYNFSADPLVLWLQQQTGYRLEFCQLPRNSDMNVHDTRPVWQQMDADLFLNFSYGDDVLLRFGNQGELLDLQEYYNDRTLSAPFWDALEENFSPREQALILSSLTQSETGAIYTVPALEEPTSRSMDYQLWINTHWLSQAGLEMPRTTQELMAVLECFKQQHPGCIPLLGGDLSCPAPGCDVVSWLINQSVYFDSRQPLLGEKESPSPTILTPEFRQALTYVHRLVKDGYLMTQSETKELEALIVGQDAEAVCGIFAMDRASMTDPDAPILEQYAPLPPLEGQYCISNPPICLGNSFIPADTPYPRQAFAVMMALFTPQGTQQMLQSHASPLSLRCCGLFPGNRHPASDAALVLYQQAAQARPVPENLEKKALYDTYEMNYRFLDYMDRFITGKADPSSDAHWAQYLLFSEQAV